MANQACRGAECERRSVLAEARTTAGSRKRDTSTWVSRVGSLQDLIDICPVLLRDLGEFIGQTEQRVAKSVQIEFCQLGFDRRNVNAALMTPERLEEVC